MKSVPQELLERLQKIAPPGAEVLPLPWAFEHEDYNIAVVMPETTTREESRQLRDYLLDVVMDWDDTHDTFTVCKIWREHEKVLAGIR